jgi:hypothetical protein
LVDPPGRILAVVRLVHDTMVHDRPVHDRPVRGRPVHDMKARGNRRWMTVFFPPFLFSAW